jgi:hypothetical protein
VSNLPYIASIDFQNLFESAPALYLVLKPDSIFTIVAVSDAYLAATMTEREKILGCSLFDVFPDNPDDPVATGVSNLRASLSRVVKNKVVDAMAVQKYDVRRPSSQGVRFEERYWSPLNSPVFGKDNELVYIIHRVEDVTEFIYLKHQESERSKLTEALRLKAEQMEAEIFVRAQQLQDVNKQLRKTHEELERRVEERTLELSSANNELQRQMAELKRAESHIREQSALLDKTQDAIIVQNLAGDIVFWNRSAECLYGWNGVQAISKNANDLLYVAEMQKNLAVNALAMTMEQGEWKGELYQNTSQGKEIIVESRWTLVCDDTGKAKTILIINSDITEKKIQAAQFLRAQRMESIGTLAGGIAHDLNNLLSPILMGLEILANKLIDQRSQRIISTMEESAIRGADMVRQVLSFARGIEGEHILVQPKHLIIELEKMLKHTFPKLITINVSLTNNLGIVLGDATQLYQVLMNFCVNARDAMPQGGVLTIEASNTIIDEHYVRMNSDVSVGQYVVIKVNDTGIGMPPEVSRRIFEPFFTTKEIGKGTGLGLSTSLTIVKSHKGFINVYSEVGKGTEFKLYLPIANQTLPNKVDKERKEFFNGKGETILVVDDEKAIREITRITLEAYGYKVLIAEDGMEAVAVYAPNAENIKLVILDMMMPNLDGQTTAKILYKINPSIKIISTSGFISNGKTAEGLGVKAFLTKPYNAEALLKIVAEVLSNII